MTTKRFEIVLSGGEVSQYEIIDHEQEQLTVYNELGNVYFSSALQLCDLLNELHEENQDLKSFNKDLAENLSACANARISKDNLIEKLTTENEQLKKELNAFKPIVFEDVNGGSSILYEKVEK